MTTNTSKRFVGEVVELSRDCELGQEGARAVVSALAGHYMTLTFPDRGPDVRDVHTGADYKHLRPLTDIPHVTNAKVHAKSMDRGGALRELRSIVATYLEGSSDAARAMALIDTFDALVPRVQAPTAPPDAAQEDRQCAMFGCTAAEIDEVLNSKEPRDIAMYAMGTLSNAQEYIRRSSYEGKIEWTVADRDANTLRQLINIAKYAIDKAVPR